MAEEIKKVKLVDTKGNQVYPEIDPKDGGVAIERVDNLPEEPTDKFYFKNSSEEKVEYIAPEDIDRQPIPASGYLKKCYININDFSDEEILEFIDNTVEWDDKAGEGNYYVFGNEDSSTYLQFYAEGSKGNITNAEIYLTGCYATDLDGYRYQWDGTIWVLNYGWSIASTDITVDTNLFSIPNQTYKNDQLVNFICCYQDATLPRAAIPTEGVLGQFYVNTNLSIEEVNQIFESLTYQQFDQNIETYPIYVSKTLNIANFIDPSHQEEEFYKGGFINRWQVNDNYRYQMSIGGTTFEWAGFDTADNQYTQYSNNYGWADLIPAYVNPLKNEDERVPVDASKTKFFADYELMDIVDFNDYIPGFSLTVGAENDKLKNLIYIADIVEEEKVNDSLEVKLGDKWKFVPVLDEGKNGQVLSYINKEIYKAVPNQGDAKEISFIFDTTITPIETFEILKGLDYKYVSANDSSILITDPLFNIYNEETTNGMAACAVAYLKGGRSTLTDSLNGIKIGIFTYNLNNQSFNSEYIFEYFIGTEDQVWHTDIINELLNEIKNAPVELNYQDELLAGFYDIAFGSGTVLDHNTYINVGTENDKLVKIFNAGKDYIKGTAWIDVENAGKEDGSKELTEADITEIAAKLGHDIYPIQNITIDSNTFTIDGLEAAIKNNNIPEEDTVLNTCYLRKDKILYLVIPFNDFVSETIYSDPGTVAEFDLYDTDHNDLGTIEGACYNALDTNYNYWYTVIGLALPAAINYDSNFINLEFVNFYTPNNGGEVEE